MKYSHGKNENAISLIDHVNEFGWARAHRNMQITIALHHFPITQYFPNATISTWIINSNSTSRYCSCCCLARADAHCLHNRKLFLFFCFFSSMKRQQKTVAQKQSESVKPICYHFYGTLLYCLSPDIGHPIIPNTINITYCVVICRK